MMRALRQRDIDELQSDCKRMTKRRGRAGGGTRVTMTIDGRRDETRCVIVELGCVLLGKTYV